MWISPRDLTSQWQDYTGTTPVVTPGTVADSSNPVGLAYDLRAGTVTASPSTADLSGATWVRNWATTLGNQITFTGQYGNIGNTGFFPANTAAVSIGRIVLTLDIEHVSGNTNLSTAFRDLAAPGGNVIYPLILTSGQRTTLTQIHVFIGDVPPVSPEILIVQDRNASNFAVVKLHSVTYAYTPGNHMLQSTSAARPLLSARVNLLTYTEDFSNAVWAAENTTVNPTNKQSVKETATNTNHTVYYAAPILSEYSAGSKVSFQLAAKPEGQNYVTSVLLQGAGIWASVTVDLSTSTITQQLVAGGFAIESATATAGTGNLAGYTILEFVVTSSNTSSMDFPSICLSDSGTFTPVNYGRNIYMGDPLKGVRVAYAQVANGGGASYQPILTDGSSYSSTGFPIAQLYDGVDDGMATAAFTAGTLIDGMDCMIAVRRDSAAATYLISDTASRGFFEWESGDTDRPDVSAGTPTYYVDGVACTATRGALFTALTAGDWHILEARGLDLSTWLKVEVSSLVSYRLNGARGDILLFPSTASTEDKDAARQYLADYYGVTLP
jgi:hypothetical protein